MKKITQLPGALCDQQNQSQENHYYVEEMNNEGDDDDGDFEAAMEKFLTTGATRLS